MDAYETALSFDPNFGMALGNKAIELYHFVELSGAFRKLNILEIYHDLKKAIADPDPRTTPEARKEFKGNLQEIMERYKENIDFSEIPIHPKSSIQYPLETMNRFFEICAREHLFLCLCFHRDPKYECLRDDFIPPPSIKNIPHHLLTNILDEYLTARYLFILGTNLDPTASGMQEWINLKRDPSIPFFNLRVEYLKSSIRQSIDILDKIAGGINKFFKLNSLDFKVHFYGKVNIWKDAKKIKDDSIRKQSEPKKGKFIMNPSTAYFFNSYEPDLYALFDIYLDFKSEYYKSLRDIRNSIVHRYLVSVPENEEDLDKGKVSFNRLNIDALNAIKLARSAIMYFFNFVRRQNLNY